MRTTLHVGRILEFSELVPKYTCEFLAMSFIATARQGVYSFEKIYPNRVFPAIPVLGRNSTALLASPMSDRPRAWSYGNTKDNSLVPIPEITLMMSGEYVAIR